MTMSNDQNTAVVMSESEWFKLCSRMCKARRKKYGEDQQYCEEHSGICPECADDALAAAPAKYRTTDERAANFDTLQGCQS
jgi:hypothetical protein